MKDIRRRTSRLRAAGVFTFGAAIGSLVALLCAPASGCVTRRRLLMKARNLQRAAARRLGQTRRILTSKAEDVREAATEWFAGRAAHRNGRHPARRRSIRQAHAGT